MSIFSDYQWDAVNVFDREVTHCQILNGYERTSVAFPEPFTIPHGYRIVQMATSLHIYDITGKRWRSYTFDPDTKTLSLTYTTAAPTVDAIRTNPQAALAAHAGIPENKEDTVNKNDVHLDETAYTARFMVALADAITTYRQAAERYEIRATKLYAEAAGYELRGEDDIAEVLREMANRAEVKQCDYEHAAYETEFLKCTMIRNTDLADW